MLKCPAAPHSQPLDPRVSSDGHCSKLKVRNRREPHHGMADMQSSELKITFRLLCRYFETQGANATTTTTGRLREGGLAQDREHFRLPLRRMIVFISGRQSGGTSREAGEGGRRGRPARAARPSEGHNANHHGSFRRRAKMGTRRSRLFPLCYNLFHARPPLLPPTCHIWSSPTAIGLDRLMRYEVRGSEVRGTRYKFGPMRRQKYVNSC